MSTINPKNAYSNYASFIADLLDGVVEENNNSPLKLSNFSGLDLGKLNLLEEDAWKNVLLDLDKRVGGIGNSSLTTGSVGKYIDSNSDLSVKFDYQSDSENVDSGKDITNDYEGYWNKSLQAIFNKLNETMTSRAAQGNPISDAEKMARTADAGYTFRTDLEMDSKGLAKNAKDSYVLPMFNLAQERYTYKNKEPSKSDVLRNTARKLDRIKTSLGNNRNLQYTANQNKPGIKNSAGVRVYNTNINQLIRLLMPKYIRSLEIEDLNRNFWVIGTTLTLLLNSLGDYKDYVYNLSKAILDEIIQLWMNVEFLWIEQKVSSQTQDVLTFFVPFSPDSFTNQIKQNNFCSFNQRMNNNDTIDYLSEEYRGMFSTINNFVNMSIDERRDFLIHIGKNYYDYLTQEYPNNSILIIPEIRISNYKFNYYNQACYLGMILYDTSISQEQKWFAIPFEQTLSVDLVGEIIGSDEGEPYIFSSQNFYDLHKKGVHYDPRTDKLLTNNQICYGKTKKPIKLLGVHENKVTKKYEFRSKRNNTEFNPNYFTCATRTKIMGSVKKQFNDGKGRNEIVFENFYIKIEDAIQELYRSNTNAPKSNRWVGYALGSGQNCHLDTETIKNNDCCFPLTGIQGSPVSQLTNDTDLMSSISTDINKGFDQGEVCSWYLQKEHTAISTDKSTFDAEIDLAVKLDPDAGLIQSISTTDGNDHYALTGYIEVILSPSEGDDIKFVVPVNSNAVERHSVPAGITFTYHPAPTLLYDGVKLSEDEACHSYTAYYISDDNEYMVIPVRIKNLQTMTSTGHIQQYYVKTSFLTYKQDFGDDSYYSVAACGKETGLNDHQESIKTKLKNFASNYRWKIYGSNTLMYKLNQIMIKYEHKEYGLNIVSVPVLPLNYPNYASIYAETKNKKTNEFVNVNIVAPSDNEEEAVKTLEVTNDQYKLEITNGRQGTQFFNKPFLLGQSLLLGSINWAEDNGDFNWFEDVDNQYQKNYPTIMFADSEFLASNQYSYDKPQVYVKDNYVYGQLYKDENKDYFAKDYQKVSLNFKPAYSVAGNNKKCHVRPTYLANTQLTRVMYGGKGHYYKHGVNYLKCGVPARTNVPNRWLRQAWFYQKKDKSMVEDIKGDDWLVKVNTVFYEIINKVPGIQGMDMDLTENQSPETKYALETVCVSEIFNGNEVVIKCKKRAYKNSNGALQPTNVINVVDASHELMEAENRFSYILKSYMQDVVNILYMIYCELPSWYDDNGKVTNSSAVQGIVWDIASRIQKNKNVLAPLVAGFFSFVSLHKDYKEKNFANFFNIFLNTNINNADFEKYILPYNFKNLIEFKKNIQDTYGKLDAYRNFYNYITDFGNLINDRDDKPEDSEPEDLIKYRIYKAINLLQGTFTHEFSETYKQQYLDAYFKNGIEKDFDAALLGEGILYCDVDSAKYVKKDKREIQFKKINQKMIEGVTRTSDENARIKTYKENLLKLYDQLSEKMNSEEEYALVGVQSKRQYISREEKISNLTNSYNEEVDFDFFEHFGSGHE